MAAFTGTYNSTQYARAVGVLKADPLDGGGAKLQPLYGKHTHPAGDNGTGAINLIHVPAGLYRIYPDLSRLVTSQTGASSTISIGTAAYVSGTTGLPVAAVPAALHSVGASGAGALDVALALPANGALGLELNSRDGVAITATIASGDIEATDTIELTLVVAKIG